MFHRSRFPACWFRILARLLAAGALLLLPGITVAQRPHVAREKHQKDRTTAADHFEISGITTVNSIDAERTGRLFDTSDSTRNAYANPNTSGVTFRTSWASVEPADGTFDFSKLDTVFSNAEQNGKWVELVLIPGFGTPKWALEGVQTVTCPIPYGPGGKAGKPLPLPVPWDRTYLSRWFSFLRAVGQKYAGRSSFRKVAAAGPTSVSAEMSLPNRPADLAEWKHAGYTSEKYIDAWRQTFAVYAATFPRQYFSLALYPGLPIPDQRQRTYTREQVIRLGLRYPNQFALEEDGLNAERTRESFGYRAVRDHIGRVATGYMMSTSAVNRSEHMGASGDPPLALRKSIDLAMKPNEVGQRVNFLEIYEADVTAQEMQEVLRYGASIFRDEPGLQPQ